MAKAQRDILGKTRFLKYAEQIGNVRKRCRYLGNRN